MKVINSLYTFFDVMSAAIELRNGCIKNGGSDAYKNHSSLGGRGGGSKREKPSVFLREKKKIFESFVSRNLLNSIF